MLVSFPKINCSRTSSYGQFFSFAEVAIFTCGRHFEFAKSNLKTSTRLFQAQIEVAGVAESHDNTPLTASSGC